MYQQPDKADEYQPCKTEGDHLNRPELLLCNKPGGNILAQCDRIFASQLSILLLNSPEITAKKV
jgi:hypothetical protein